MNRTTKSLIIAAAMSGLVASAIVSVTGCSDSTSDKTAKNSTTTTNDMDKMTPSQMGHMESNSMNMAGSSMNHMASNYMSMAHSPRMANMSGSMRASNQSEIGDMTTNSTNK